MRHADNIEPRALLHQLRGCVPRVRTDRAMVPMAAHPGSTSTGRAAPVSSLRLPARQWLDVLDAGSRLAAAAACLRGTDRLWRSDRVRSRASRARWPALRELSRDAGRLAIQRSGALRPDL